MVFTQQLATLLGAGQPLDRALQILLDLPDSERAKKLLERVRESVRGGTPLSSALEQQHGVFSRLYVNMVRAGEASGSLQETLRRLAEYLERSRAMREGVVNALIYPAILLVLVVGALALLLIYVVPQFVPLFEDMGVELPLITRFVLRHGRLPRRLVVGDGGRPRPASCCGRRTSSSEPRVAPGLRHAPARRALDRRPGGTRSRPRAWPAPWELCSPMAFHC